MKGTFFTRLAAFTVAATMTVALAACGAQPAAQAPAAPEAAPAEEAPAEEAAPAEETEAPAENGELTKITFCLDWTPNTNHTGLYVAQAMGFYAEAGLDVEIVQPPEDGAVLMCAAGQAQFAIANQDTFAAVLDSSDEFGVDAIAAVVQHNTSGIMSRKGDGIESAAGLAGKTYSTWESPIEMAMIQNCMEVEGADFSSVKLIPNTITDEPAALAANQTDAIWVFYGWGGINADIEGVEVDYWDFIDINPVFDYYTPVIIGNNDYMSANEDLTKAFLEATKKGYMYAIDHPEEAADMLIAGDTTGSLSGCEDLVYASQKWLGEQYMADVELWGYIDPARWNAFYGWLYENGLTSNDLTDVGFNNNYLSSN